MAQTPAPVKITDVDLITAMPDRHLTGPQAKEIISDTKKVMIEGIEAKETNRNATAIIVEAPPNLSQGLWSVILLSGEPGDDQITAILNYDSVTQQFPAPDDEVDEDEEEEGRHNGRQRRANHGRVERG